MSRRQLLQDLAEAIPALEARVLSSFVYSKATACAGAEFLKDTWRPVPPGREVEAKKTNFLETREIVMVNGAYSKGVIAKAEELGVTLEDVKGSGAKGKVLVKDVEAAAPEEGKEAETKEKTYSDAVIAKAEKLGVDLEEVEGSGSNGNVIVKDVKEFAAERDADE